MFRVEVYIPAGKRYRTVRTYATWGAAVSRQRLTDGTVRVRNVETGQVWK